ncbi:hypothetical protein [Streptomyces sp. CL12-4]|uniref:hypothetical protein n=1 Tax=Streptomyces sp. CL12-4 TaxID=2810306 RepID=UPI001EFABCF0|nr:hypothetical protein [Streptomyces sp. CL12-4]MCG8965467.1 hypothetical protein [Streptomyces sp. CL12-4]
MLGGPDGHLPLFLPYEKLAADQLRQKHGSNAFTCGIHVQMARRSFKEWQADGERLTAPVGKPATIRMYGPESQLAPFELDATGHALRFRCATEDGTRVVHVGTHPPGHRVEWTTLDKCRLVHAGIVTPWLEETPYGIRPKGTVPASSAKRPAAEGRKAQSAQEPAVRDSGSGAGPVLPLMTGRVAFTGAASVSEEGGRGLYDVDAQPIGSAMFRARISLPGSGAAPEPHHVYVLTDRAAVLNGPQLALPDSRWMLRAEGFVRLASAKAAEWELLKPHMPAREEDATAATAPDPQQRLAPPAGVDKKESPSPLTPTPAQPVPAPDDRLVAELTRVLVRTAREGTTITWYELLKQTGTRPDDVNPARQLRLLTAVDAPHAKAHRPLLSSLITFSREAQPHDDTPPPFFRQVLLALGWPHWTDAAGAAKIWKDHRTRIHRARSSERPGPAQGAEASGLPPARPREDPVGRLQTILRYLEETEAELPFPALNRAVREADDLALLIGNPFLPTPVLQRLSHWRKVLRRRLGGPGTPDSPPREVFDKLADEFRTARDAGDLVLARRVHGAMGPVYALRLSPQDREAVTGLMREFKQWLRDKEAASQADGSLEALRRILHDLGSREATLTTAEIADALTEADRIRRGLADPLPEADDEALRRRRADLRHRLTVESGSDSTLASLAARVRTLLQDAARAGAMVTWEELDRRVGAQLRHLPAADEGEILFLVDEETPADEPPLAALVADADLSPHRQYRRVRDSRGRQRVPEQSLEMHWRMDVLELHQLWRHR